MLPIQGSSSSSCTLRNHNRSADFDDFVLDDQENIAPNYVKQGSSALPIVAGIPIGNESIVSDSHHQIQSKAVLSDEEFWLGIKRIDSLDSWYRLGPTIGRGEFAKVKVAHCLTTGQKVAVKIVTLGSDKDLIRIVREIRIHSTIDHEHVVHVLRVLKLPRHLAIVMEYVDGGELFDHVQSQGFLVEMQVRVIMQQLFQAVDYLHKRGIVHRDLKLENVLKSQTNDKILLSDFGFARSFHHNYELLKTSCGSPCYAAPELVLDSLGYFGPPADLWSCGVIMYAMTYGHLPFESDLVLDRDLHTNTIRWTPSNVYQLYQHISTHALCIPETDHRQTFSSLVTADDSDQLITSNGNKHKMHRIRGLSLIGQDLLLRLLDPNPKTRITMTQIWQHSWWTLQ